MNHFSDSRFEKICKRICAVVDAMEKKDRSDACIPGPGVSTQEIVHAYLGSCFQDAIIKFEGEFSVEDLRATWARLEHAPVG